jgi:hypothetical protein
VILYSFLIYSPLLRCLYIINLKKSLMASLIIVMYFLYLILKGLPVNIRVVKVLLSPERRGAKEGDARSWI